MFFFINSKIEIERERENISVDFLKELSSPELFLLLFKSFSLLIFASVLQLNSIKVISFLLRFFLFKLIRIDSSFFSFSFFSLLVLLSVQKQKMKKKTRTRTTDFESIGSKKKQFESVKKYLKVIYFFHFL